MKCLYEKPVKPSNIICYTFISKTRSQITTLKIYKNKKKSTRKVCNTIFTQTTLYLT